jgi:hypothetical protein
MEQESERAVELKGVDERVAPGMLHREGVVGETTAAAVAGAVPKFKPVSFPEFRAQHAIIDGNIVIQFFLPEAAGNLEKADARTQQRWAAYWLEVFPSHLSRVAKAHFRADKPRLVAKYTEDLRSWWFRAQGYGESLNPDGLVTEFYSKLVEALQLARD